MQQDHLLIESTRLASIDDKILAMPITYNSLVGHGRSLSDGQKQLVLSAEGPLPLPSKNGLLQLI